MDYRKIYYNKVGCDVPNNWHIHHIDHNRSNNNPGNLLALPDFLHESLHFYKGLYSDSVFFEHAINGCPKKESLHRMVEVLDLVKECRLLEDRMMFIDYNNWQPDPKIYDEHYTKFKEIFNSL